MAHVELKNVTKIYQRSKLDPVLAVEKLNLSIEHGKIIALLGPSGCGKTSTLRMLAGFESFTEGDFFLAGRRLNDVPPKDRNIAMAFEGYALYPTLTVRDNIRFSLLRRGSRSSEQEKKFDEIVEFLELGPILEQYPVKLSSGEQQKTSLARALLKDSDLCLLDEPLSQLESSVRIKLRARIKEFLLRNKMTSVLVTHNQSDAIALADKVAVMHNGELMQFSNIEKLKKNPKNLFVAGFIGQPPMNLLPARARVTGKTLEIALLNEAGDPVWTYQHKGNFKSASKKYLDNEIVVGIRPHGIKLSPVKKSSQRTSSLHPKATVILHQWMGDQSDVVLSLGGLALTALSYEALPVQAGDLLNLMLSNEELHLFSKETGETFSLF